MPYRKTIFVEGEIYHTVCRGVARQPIFKDKKDYLRILSVIDFYRYVELPMRFSFYNRLLDKQKNSLITELGEDRKVLVEILAFCLMPNHIHFLLKQTYEKGIPVFMRNFQNSYARYFNTRHNRIGALFQSMFRAIRIESDEQLIHVSRYIHLNPVSAYLIEIKDLASYPWSSFQEYINNSCQLKLVNTNLVLDYFQDKEKYKKFVFDQADYQRKLEKIKHLTLER